MNILSVRKPVWLVALAILALAQSACNYATQLVSGLSAPRPGTPQPASCVNKYLPAQAGATRTLSGSGYTETITIPSLRKSAFEEKWLEGPINGKQTINYYSWDCTSAGLVLSGINSNMFFDIQGVTVPVSVKAGDQWTQSYKDLMSTVTDSYTAIGEESITVPAGTFTALKIQKNTVSSAPNIQPVKIDGFQWWAEGIGTIKTSFIITAKSVNTTTPPLVRELQSYSNP